MEDISMDELANVFAVMESVPVPVLAQMLQEANRIWNRRVQAERESMPRGASSRVPRPTEGCDD